MTLRNVQQVLTVLAAPAIICRRDGTVVDVNDRAAIWLGSTSACASGRPVTELLDATEATEEPFERFIERSLRDDHALYAGRLHQRADRVRRSPMICHAQRLIGLDPLDAVLLTFARAPAPENKTTSIAGAGYVRTRDDGITVALAKQPATNDPLLPDPGSLGDIALGLAHEIYQPLTAIATYARSCQRRIQAGQTDHPGLLPTLDKIIDQVDATGRLIKRLKGLVNDHDAVYRTCDLNAIVREAIDLLALDPRVAPCKIESLLEKETCKVNVDPVQIQLVLLNLMRNAVEASLAIDDGAPRVHIAVEADSRCASVTVRDSGPGVPDSAKKRVFDASVTGKSNGLGLGLAISRRLATSHAGRVDCLGVMPRGAAFQLSLPRAG